MSQGIDQLNLQQLGSLFSSCQPKIVYSLHPVCNTEKYFVLEFIHNNNGMTMQKLT